MSTIGTMKHRRTYTDKKSPLNTAHTQHTHARAHKNMRDMDKQSHDQKYTPRIKRAYIVGSTIASKAT